MERTDMNNSVVQKNNVTYLHIGDWYIGVHLINNGELVIFADHDQGKVHEYEIATEDDNQWGKILRVDLPRQLWDVSRQRNTLRSRVRVEVTP